MKKILAVFLLAPFAVTAQVGLSFGIGGITNNHTYPIFKLGIHAQVKNIVFEAAEYPAISREVDAGKYLGGSIGYNIYGFIPSAGYYYCIHSSDEKLKSMNGWHWKAALKYKKDVTTNAGFFAEAFYIDNHSGLVAGISYDF